MRLYVRNKVVSLGGSSYVCDERGNKVLQVQGKVFSFTHKKHICDLQGNRLFTVRNKFISFPLPKAFILDANGQKIEMLRKQKLFSFHKSFFVEGVADDIRIEGDVIGWKFAVFKNGVQIAFVQRSWETAADLFRDAYVLDVVDEWHAAFAVALVVAIDNYFDDLEDSHD